MTTPHSILEFWFGDDPSTFEGILEKLGYWSPSLDETVRSRFGATIEQAFGGGFEDWQGSHEGTLALIVVLDQLPRHAYRGSARQYAGDARALELALKAWNDGWPLDLGPWRALYMALPLAHAEDLASQVRHLEVATQISARCPDFWGDVAQVPQSQARKYHAVIERFGRFPHRNAILGRASTPEELEWLAAGGAESMPPDILKRLLS